jgi:hypothetical protein
MYHDEKDLEEQNKLYTSRLALMHKTDKQNHISSASFLVFLLKKQRK